jgi:hypothetical protein
VSNDDSDPASPFVVVDTLPAETTLVSCSATGGGICNGTSVSFASLDGGASATITIVANVNCPVHDQTDITNSADVEPVVPDPDADEFENDSVTVTVLNPPPQVINASATPSMLWPANHKFVDVAVSYTIIDNCGPVSVVLSVASNEPVNGTGDGDTAPDWQVLSDHRVRLRAERAGNGTGRTYTVTITATDSAGGSGSANVTVSVPHDN